MKKISIMEFTLADVDDPWLYAELPIWHWKTSDQGKWIMENALEHPEYNVTPCINTHGYSVRIIAKLSDENTTFFRLKWP